MNNYLWSNGRINECITSLLFNRHTPRGLARRVSYTVRDEYEAQLATLQQENARIAEDKAMLQARVWELDAELAALQPTGEVIDTIKRSLVSSESINDTYAWMKRVDAATKWISALEETT